MAISRERMWAARRFGIAAVALFWLVVAGVAVWSHDVGSVGLIAFQIGLALLSTGFIYTGMMRVADPGIPLRVTEYHTEQATISGTRTTIQREGDTVTGTLSRNAAWFLAVGPTAAFYGGGVAASLGAAGILNQTITAVLLMVSVVVVFIGPLVLHIAKSFLAARDLRVPQELSGIEEITAANQQRYRLSLSVIYQLADGGIQKLAVALSERKSTSAAPLVRSAVRDALDAWRPERSAVENAASLAGDRRVLGSINQALDAYGLTATDLSISEATRLPAGEP